MLRRNHIMWIFKGTIVVICFNWTPGLNSLCLCYLTSRGRSTPKKSLSFRPPPDYVMWKQLHWATSLKINGVRIGTLWSFNKKYKYVMSIFLAYIVPSTRKVVHLGHTWYHYESKLDFSLLIPHAHLIHP